MAFSLTLLGTNAAVPYRNRFLAGQVLSVDTKLYLVDCGEGTQFRITDLHIKKSKINEIFISHLHGDHIFGLAGLITSMGLAGRTQPLTVFGPAGLAEIMTTTFHYSHFKAPFELNFTTVGTTDVVPIFEDAFVTVYTLPLLHRVPATGYLFVEKPRPLNIDIEAVQAHNIPISALKSIKTGADWVNTEGGIVPNAQLTRPPKPQRRYAYCSDTMYNEALIPHLKEVDLLYHETTFLDDMADHAAISGHSTARQAAMIAQKAGVKKLITGHYSSRYDDLSPILAEAQAVFPNTVLGIDGATYMCD